MAKQKAFDPPKDDVPAWVMTFSDVITLLMTFFILLLTFATNQPETFERMQVAMFGGGGSDGFAGQREGMDKDTLLMRERARAGRIAKDGSQIPPIYSDPELETLSKGIAGLEQDEHRELTSSHRIEHVMGMMFNSQGELTGQGKQIARMLAAQIRKRPIQMDIAVASQAAVAVVQGLVDYLTTAERIPHAAVGVALAPHQVGEGLFVIVLSHERG